MSNIVERLREAHKRGPHIMNDFRIFNEAADEIERLLALLEPFARARGAVDAPKPEAWAAVRRALEERA